MPRLAPLTLSLVLLSGCLQAPNDQREGLPSAGPADHAILEELSALRAELASTASVAEELAAQLAASRFDELWAVVESSSNLLAQQSSRIEQNRDALESQASRQLALEEEAARAQEQRSELTIVGALQAVGLEAEVEARLELELDLQEQSSLLGSQTELVQAQGAQLVEHRLDLDLAEQDIEGNRADVEALDLRTADLHSVVSVDPVAGSVVISGVNLYLQSGSGRTDDLGNPLGLGNLVIGYDEDASSLSTSWAQSDKSGSHNLVVGAGHSYSGVGGLVAGKGNRVEGPWATVLGGKLNQASGAYSTVGGGLGNLASGAYSAVFGGSAAEASGDSSVVTGGYGGTASGDWASTSGGGCLQSSTELATASGALESYTGLGWDSSGNPQCGMVAGATTGPVVSF